MKGLQALRGYGVACLVVIRRFPRLILNVAMLAAVLTALGLWSLRWGFLAGVVFAAALILVVGHR